jgi:elongation factor Ts
MTDINLVKKLRDLSGAGYSDCILALKETNNDLNNSVIFLRKKGLADVREKTHKQTSEGAIGSYVHTGGRIGVLVEVQCQTDFSSKSPDFQRFVKDLAMHIAASNPLWINRSNVPPDIVEREREIASADIKGKPPQVVEKIIDGRIGKYFKAVCLLEQQFVKDPNITIEELLGELASKIKENIVIKKFVRFEI